MKAKVFFQQEYGDDGPMYQESTRLITEFEVKTLQEAKDEAEAISLKYDEDVLELHVDNIFVTLFKNGVNFEDLHA
jgi:hypothetical protein